ncbi:MAG: ABC transporter ATP-binding protein [Anaerolineae bacterium]|nr:ABC transporter ATP-binding protein [Anaerolineae bacterium]
MGAIRKLIQFLGPYRHWVILAPVTMLFEVAVDLLQPRMIERIIDDGIVGGDMSVVINAGLWMLGLSVVGAVGGIASTTFAVLASQGFGTDLRDALFAKVHSLSFGNFDELETGGLVTRLTNDVSQLQQLVSMMLRIMIRAPLLIIGSLIMAILTSPRLALMFVILVPLIGAILGWVVNKAYPMFGDVQERLDSLNTVMQENLAGVRVVKAFVRGAYEIARFGRVNDELMAITVRAARVVALSSPAITTALHVGVVAAVYLGGFQVVAGTLRIGQVIAFIYYLTRTSWALMFVSMLSMRVARAQASAERVQEVLDSMPHVQDRPDARDSFSPEGRVAFDDVTFAYADDGNEPVLRNVTFRAEPGQTVAVLGATGSGKTTLVNLIPRFYDVSGGAVTIDGVDVRDLDQAALRQHIGVALQEPVLFSGTIRDNIRYGRPDATDEEVVAAAKAAQADEFIMALPAGYDSVLGQRGVNVSGGQKQRLAIARALLVKPKVLILDDSTSSVDVETEAKIQEALEALINSRDGLAGRLNTTFVIAQRISTVLNADKILVLDQGRIAAEGTHKELMASSAIYREIYDSQLGNGVGGRG